MKTILRLLLAVAAFIAGPAFAAWGWSGGDGTCHVSPATAGAHICASIREFDYQSNLANPYLYLTCANLPVAPSCGTAEEGAFCSVALTLQPFMFAASGGTSVNGSSRTRNHVMAACDLGDSLPDKIADMSLLWALFFGAAIVILAMRKFANIWERSPHAEL